MQHEKSGAKKGKLAVSVVAAAALMLTAACSGGGGGSDDASSQGKAGDGSLGKIKNEGQMTIGVKFDTPPYGYIAEGESEPQGFDVDITAEIAKRLGVEPKFVEVSSENRIPYLQTGRIDLIAASMFHTRTRDEAIDFTATYFEDANKFLVPAESSLKGIEDLAGKTVTLTQGSTQQAAIERLAPDAEVLAFQDWPSALQAMLRGDAVAVVSSSGILAGLKQRANDAGKDVKIVGEGFAPSPVAMGVRKNESELRDAVNFALMEMYEDGTYDRIFKKWWSGIFPEAYEVETWPKG
jgi:ABC-type amino acid transport substrate-binding protein